MRRATGSRTRAPLYAWPAFAGVKTRRSGITSRRGTWPPRQTPGWARNERLHSPRSSYSSGGGAERSSTVRAALRPLPPCRPEPCPEAAKHGSGLPCGAPEDPSQVISGWPPLFPPPGHPEACPAAPRQPGIVGLPDRLRRVDDLLAGGQLHLHVVQLGLQHVGARAVGLPPLLGPI